MLTFSKIHESIFSSFRINDTSHFLNELEQEKIEKVIIIKRSWVFGLFVSMIFFLIILVTGMNIYYMAMHHSSPYIFYGLVGLIIINVVWELFSGILYIVRFRRLHKKSSTLTGIHDINLVKRAIIEEENIFTRFFNQITTSYFLFVVITFFYIYYLLIGKWNQINLSSIFEVFLLIIQIILIAYYRYNMVNLEMDYIIVIPNRLYFIDQMGIFKRSQSIKWVTNIRLITSSYPSFLGSLCNYGTIEVMVKGDTPSISTSYHMRYVDNPIEIVNQINQLIEKDSGSNL